MKMNRKGSITVLACLFFVTLVTLISVYIQAAKATALSSAVKSLGNLWGESILAEYDLNLYNRYGIFGFYGQTADVTEKLDFYAIESFDQKSYVNYEGSKARLYDYSLVNVDVFRAQVIKAGKYVISDFCQSPEPIKRIDMDSGFSSQADLFQCLPSGGQKNSTDISDIVTKLKSATSIGEILQNTSASYFENCYIEHYFKCKTNSEELGETFFNNEREYIICGKLNDEDNSQGVKMRIIGVREGLNLACIMKNPSMSAEAMTVAEAITPGPSAAATQKVLIAAWAFAESVNDYKLLLKGHKIPIMKNEATWATDLESILNNTEDDVIFTGVDEGESYEDYLNFFLYFMDERLKLMRVMDLIQINNRYLYYSDFLLRNYNAGVFFQMKVNGKNYEFNKNY